MTAPGLELCRDRRRYWAISAGTPGMSVTRTFPGKTTSPANTPVPDEMANVAEPLFGNLVP